MDHASEVYEAAGDLARRTNGHYIDQFTYAERATDWRGNNNIAESIFGQLALEEHPIPRWIVVGAGTGGTSATIGRYLRTSATHGTRRRGSGEFRVLPRLAGEPRRPAPTSGPGRQPSRIEGIGRARLEPSFVPAVIDHMVQVPDAASVAAMRHLKDYAGLHAGPSTGTNLWGVWQLIAGMIAEGRRGSVVSLMCDGGDRYAGNYYNPDWLRARAWIPNPMKQPSGISSPAGPGRPSPGAPTPLRCPRWRGAGTRCRTSRRTGSHAPPPGPPVLIKQGVVDREGFRGAHPITKSTTSPTLFQGAWMGTSSVRTLHAVGVMKESPGW